MVNVLAVDYLFFQYSYVAPLYNSHNSIFLLTRQTLFTDFSVILFSCISSIRWNSKDFLVIFLFFLWIFLWHFAVVYNIIWVTDLSKKGGARVFIKEKRKNGTNLCIVQSYRDPITKVSKTKRIMNVGYLEDLQKQYDDPIAHFQEVAKQMTKNTVQKRNRPIWRSIQPNP